MTTIYQMYVAKHIEIDGEGNDLVCSVPSERNMKNLYTVRCVEHKDSVEVVSCNCLGHRRWGHCKHADAVQAFWTRIYKSNQEKLAAKQEVEAAIEVAEQIIAESTETHESTTIQAIESSKDLGTVGNLNGAPTSREMPAWLAILPSRRALAS